LIKSYKYVKMRKLQIFIKPIFVTFGRIGTWKMLRHRGFHVAAQDRLNTQSARMSQQGAILAHQIPEPALESGQEFATATENALGTEEPGLTPIETLGALKLT
jgi:hypothetical protein